VRASKIIFKPELQIKGSENPQETFPNVDNVSEIPDNGLPGKKSLAGIWPVNAPLY
jgi:hypothetical protein